MFYSISGVTGSKARSKVIELLPLDAKVDSLGFHHILFDSEEPWDFLRKRFKDIGIIGLASESRRETE